MSLVIPRAQLYECSALLRDSMEAQGVTLERHPQQTAVIAKYVLERVLPNFKQLFNEQVGVGALSVLQHIEGGQEPIMSAEFTGRLADIRVSTVVIPEEIPGQGLAVNSAPDFVLTFTHAITDPDPVDLIFSDAIIAPMGELDSLTLAAHR